MDIGSATVFVSANKSTNVWIVHFSDDMSPAASVDITLKIVSSIVFEVMNRWTQVSLRKKSTFCNHQLKENFRNYYLVWPIR